MMFPMMSPPPREHGFARAIFVTLATTIFSISILANIYFFLIRGIFSTSGPTEITLREGGSDKVSIVPIHGVINDGMVAQVKEWIKKIEKDRDVKAIVLDVDSPGGTITASDEIYHRFEELKKSRNLTIVASMGGVGASGAYYISCAADEIFAQRTTLTGSIGVVRPNYNFSELAQKWGVRDTSQTSPPNGYKQAGSPLRPETERDKAYWQALIDQAYAQFVSIVKNARKGRLTGDETQLFDGRVFTAPDAQKSGLVDQIGYLDDATDWVSKHAGLSNPTVVKFQRRATWMDLLLSKADDAPPAARGNVNLNITIDSSLIHELTTPRLEYLWTGQ